MKPLNSKFDQDVALLRDSQPRLWWGIYQGSITSGFNEEQAMALTQTFILAYGIANVIPPMPRNPINPPQE